MWQRTVQKSTRIWATGGYQKVNNSAKRRPDRRSTQEDNMKKNNFVDFLMRYGVGFALTILIIISLSVSLTAFLGVVVAWAWWQEIRQFFVGVGAFCLVFCLAFSTAGVILYGAGTWGFGGYRWGVLLNQLIGCVLLQYLLAKIIGLCSPIMLVTSSSATQSLWSVYFI